MCVLLSLGTSSEFTLGFVFYLVDLLILRFLKWMTLIIYPYIHRNYTNFLIFFCNFYTHPHPFIFLVCLNFLSVYISDFSFCKIDLNFWVTYLNWCLIYVDFSPSYLTLYLDIFNKIYVVSLFTIFSSKNIVVCCLKQYILFYYIFVSTIFSLSLLVSLSLFSKVNVDQLLLRYKALHYRLLRLLFSIFFGTRSISSSGSLGLILFIFSVL